MSKSIIEPISQLVRRHAALLRYLTAGGTAAVVEFGSFQLLKFLFTEQLQIQPVNLGFAAIEPTTLAHICSYLLGLITAFLLHHFWTFAADQKQAEHAHSARKQFVLYAAVSLTNLAISSAIFNYMVEGIKLNPSLAKFLVMGMVVLWNFAILNRFVFATKAKPESVQKSNELGG